MNYSIKAIECNGVLLNVGSDYVLSPPRPLCKVVRLVSFGHYSPPSSAEKARPVAHCQIWESCWDSWSSKGRHGAEPDRAKVILRSVPEPFELHHLVKAADILPETEFKALPDELRPDRFFFSHIQTEKGTRRTSQRPKGTVENDSTKLRVIGSAIRHAIQSNIRKIYKRPNSARVALPFHKEETRRLLAKLYSPELKGRTWRIRFDRPAQLDPLCGAGWDVHPFFDGFHNVVTALTISNASSHALQLKFKFAKYRAPFNKDSYRTKTDFFVPPL
jgi:hypothetical protein